MICCENGLLQENGDKQKLRKEMKSLVTEVNSLRAEVCTLHSLCMDAHCLCHADVVAASPGCEIGGMKQCFGVQ